MSGRVNTPHCADVYLSYRESEDDEGEECGLWAHACLLGRVEYFHTLLFGKFKEASYSQMTNPAGQVSSLIHTPLFPASHHCCLPPHQSVKRVDMSGFAMDGIQLDTIRRLIAFIYSGKESNLHHPPSIHDRVPLLGSETKSIPLDNPDLITELVAAAERIGRYR